MGKKLHSRHHQELLRHNSYFKGLECSSSQPYPTRNCENSLKKSERFLEKSMHNFTVSDYSANHRKSTCKKCRGNTIVHRFLQSI